MYAKWGVTREVWPLPVWERRVWLRMTVPRVLCRTCFVERQVPVGFADPKKTYTRAFAQYAIELSRMMTLADVARHLQISWDVVKGIVGDHLEFVVAHCLDGDLVLGQSVIEADFVFVQAEVFAALSGGLHLFGQLNSSITSGVVMARVRRVEVSVGERPRRCSDRCVSSLARDGAESHPAEMPQCDNLGRGTDG